MAGEGPCLNSHADSNAMIGNCANRYSIIMSLDGMVPHGTKIALMTGMLKKPAARSSRWSFSMIVHYKELYIMATNGKMLTAVFRDRFVASQTYSWLLNQGYRAEEVNVLMTERTRSQFRDEREEGRIKAGSKTTEGLAAGGVVGTAVGAGAAAIAAIGTSIVV